MICNSCGCPIDRTDHVMFVNGEAVCREQYLFSRLYPVKEYAGEDYDDENTTDDDDVDDYWR